MSCLNENCIASRFAAGELIPRPLPTADQRLVRQPYRRRHYRRIHPANLLITHNFLPHMRAQLDVGQAR
jgi:hypothetical protein